VAANGEHFSFWKGAEQLFGEDNFDRSDAIRVVKGHMADALGARHLSFLLGSGCSSFKRAADELGIPTMGPMAKSFLKTEGADDASPHVSTSEKDLLRVWLGLDIADVRFAGNLERLMEALYGAKFVYQGTTEEGPAAVAKVIDRVIAKVTRHVLSQCTSGAFADGDETVLNLYQSFYQKLMIRDRSLPRPWIFTTNYDLFNERAMDRRGLPYCNGFSGVVERRFNPAMFRYSLAEQLDVSNRRWSTVDGFTYLCKLHGSVNWVEDDVSLFPVRELAEVPSGETGRVLIYPTPAKQSASFVSPYSDLFREFQSQIARDQSVLVTIGYGFGDQHVNNIIFQALTIPNFRLIAFVPDDAKGVVGQLRALGDPRISLIGSDSMLSLEPAHYFHSVVADFMPDAPGRRVEDAVTKVIGELIAGSRKAVKDEDAL
jgi:hypothetical protein